RAERVHGLPGALGPGPVRELRGLPDRGAAGVPRRARPPGGLRAADAAARRLRHRPRPRDGRGRSRRARGAAARGPLADRDARSRRGRAGGASGPDDVYRSTPPEQAAEPEPEPELARETVTLAHDG